jgi:YVTN family beta-propeller protein
VSPTGSHVYVTILREDRVAVIDTTNNTIIASVPVPAGSRPYGVAVDPTGARVFVGNSDSTGVGSVSVIDTATNSAGTPVAVGASPLVFGAFVAGAQSSPPPSPTPAPSCEDTIKALQKKVGELKHWKHSQLKIAIRMRAAAQREIELAGAKVGQTHRRVVHAKKEFAQGDKLLCAGRYWRAEHEFSEAYVIARSVLRPNFWR